MLGCLVLQKRSFIFLSETRGIYLQILRGIKNAVLILLIIMLVRYTCRWIKFYLSIIQVLALLIDNVRLMKLIWSIIDIILTKNKLWVRLLYLVYDS